MSSYVSYIALVTNYSSAASFFVTAAGKKKDAHPQTSRVPKFWWVMYEAKCSDESERERTFLGVPSPGLTVPFSFVIFVR